MNPQDEKLSLSRRTLLVGAAALPAATAVQAAVAAPALPDRASFPALDGVWLDSGTTHPVAEAARRVIDAYFADRGGHLQGHPIDEAEERVKQNFAKLVGVKPAELAFVQSTTAGEHLVIDALDIPRSGGRIVTDTLHFFGSFWLYEGLAAKGMDVVWLTPRNNRIAVDDYARAITSGTKLVSLSLVSTYNGFEQDLAKVCEIAHARGAMVYADIVHAAGAIPVNLAATGVDFAATASYKWLMGDFGIGFLYARADRLPQLRRTRWGYYGVQDFKPLLPPYTDTATGTRAADVTPRNDAEGFFATGTRSHAGIVQLDWSLAYLNALGMDRLVAHRTPMMERLREGLLSRGYAVVTPEGSRTPLLTVAMPDARKRLNERLKAASIRIMLSGNRFRVSPSVFNGMDDIDRLLAAVPPLSQI